jgi:hypothetical protein
MRLSFLAIAFTMLAATASADAPNARAAYAERRGLIEADAQCRLFTSDIRAALQVGAAQARGALLRSGWTSDQVSDLEDAAVSAARGRACDDPRTATAADDARSAFATWVNAGTMEFPGWERVWIARRTAITTGWRLRSQAIDAPTPAVFGVREVDGVQKLALVIQVARDAAAPTSASLVMRDSTRARVTEVSLTQRVSYGLEAGAPAPGASATVPSTLTVERLSAGRRQAIFTFPDTAFRDLLALDPRESVELRVSSGRATQSLYVEVADIAAARTFLTIR